VIDDFSSFREYNMRILFIQYGDATEVSCSLLYKNGKAVWLTADYTMDVSAVAKGNGRDLLDLDK